MPSPADTYSLTATQKRLREEDATSSTLSNHDSREFDNITATREDPHEIGTPPIKRRRGREDKTL
jgi:hypothetical protein